MATFFAERLRVPVFPTSVADAVAAGRGMDGVVLLLDTADCTGGGSAGDSIVLVRSLLDCGAGATEDETCFAMLVDPAAAASCLAAGAGAQLELELGHSLDSTECRAAAGLPPWGEPLKATGTVLRAEADARFEYSGGMLGGSTVSMGCSAVWKVQEIKVLIMSIATYDWADEQYKRMGMEPSTAKFIGVKNMMNFRSGYSHVTDVERNAIVLNCAGPTPPDMVSLPFQRLQQPCWLPPGVEGEEEVVTEPTIELLHLEKATSADGWADAGSTAESRRRRARDGRDYDV